MRRTLLVLALGVLLGTLLVPRVSSSHWKPNTVHNREHAVVAGFCGTTKPCALGYQALRIAKCESGWSLTPRAQNGRYVGVFQVSDHWRRTVPGFRMNAWAQSRHAYRVYRLTGGWSHWSCAYIVGVL